MQRPRAVRFSLSHDRVKGELARLDSARDQSRKQLREIMTRMAQGSAAELAHLFEAQLLMLDDPMLVDRAAALVREQYVNSEWALERAYDEVAVIFGEMEDPYLRERKGDVADVVGRLQMNLRRGRGGVRHLFSEIDQPSILVAEDLPPSLAGQLDWALIGGFATDAGSRTYHTAILARSLKLPAVVGLGDASKRIVPGTLLMVDGTSGEVIVDPPESLLAEVQSRRERWAGFERSLDEYRTLPAVTADGVTVRMDANIELPDEVVYARQHGAEGVGLYRSEFLTATSPGEWMTEELQYRTYKALLEHMAPGSVTIRTFDLDEDQLSRAMRGEGGVEENGFGGDPSSSGALGLRAIRLCFVHRDIFRTQLRALLRAAKHGQLRILFPFITSVEELREARTLLNEVAAELSREGDTPPEVPVGVMIEIPSAAMTADLLAREADFLSIGTNDLIQYSLAVDRHDSRVSRLYEPLHPAILRLIRHVTRAAAQRGVPVSVCGEMAADPLLIPLLVGLGLREFSMSPPAIPFAKQVVRGLRGAEIRRIAARALRLSTVREIEQYLMSSLGEARSTEPLVGANRTREGES
jgi:phosphoenolpyruvate-protein phosphotransferase (PTS system enzyme I)